MDQHRDPHGRRLAQDGTADIAAGADSDIRPELLENTDAGAARRYRMDGRRYVPTYVLQTQPPLEAADVHRFDGIPCGGHQGGFHPPLGSHEQNLRVGIFLLDRIGDGQGGIDVPRRASAGHQYTQRFLLLLTALLRIWRKGRTFVRPATGSYRGGAAPRPPEGAARKLPYVFSDLTPLDTDSTTPICASSMTREVPP